MTANSPLSKVFDLGRPEYDDYDIRKEAAGLRAFVDKAGLTIPERFYANIRKGDVIDLYTNPPDLKQLYCNDQFRRLCSYTPEQLTSVPFPQLFWRSNDVQTQLLRRTTEIALQSTDAQSWNIANHELVETAHPRKRTFEINLGWAAPCFKSGTQERVAFVSALTVDLIFEWPAFDAGRESA